AAMENSRMVRRRQESLLAQGYIAQQEVDDTRTLYRQNTSRLQNAEASLSIIKEKVAADLQNARDQVKQAEANLEAAKAGRLQEDMKQAQVTSAHEAIRQAEASLSLRKTNKTQDRIRERAVDEARYAVAQARASLQQARAALD